MPPTLIPRPSRPSTPLIAIYRRYTGDYKAAEELVRAALLTDSDSKILVVSLRMKGYSLRQISGALGSDAKAQQMKIKAAMFRAWKIVNNIPRYYLSGRGQKKKETV